jgi:hypothetical protein
LIFFPVFLFASALSFAPVFILPSLQSSPGPVAERLWFEVAKAGRTDLFFPACQDEARSVAAVKDGDEGATAERRFASLTAA